jgi:signal transduction histidine kinase
MTMVDAPTSPPTSAQRIEELGRIILAYSEVTEKLQQSHDQLKNRIEHLQSELSEKNRELERRTRLAALGEMAAGLAHEIRNPLGGIQLYASMLAQDVADRPESARTVQKIVGGVKRVEELVSQVLHFTREINAHPSTCDVVEIVEEAIDLAKGRASAAVRFEIGLPTQLKANVDSRLLSQCVLNLVLNAVEAVGTEGVVRVTLATTEGKAFTLIIEDDGPGIAADVLDRIFNPFFTTKDEGTGLGLSIVHRIVEAHNGTISATNRPSGGAKFEIRI